MDLFQKNGYTSMIIDLRDNPGGLITSVVDVADKFIDNGLIVSTKSRLAFENQEYTASPDKTTARKNLPIIVLINQGSASASEILSGALKDYHMAYLVGQKTYGKGSVQQVIPLSDVDGMKLTMARYYTPSDVNIDKVGIPPDYEIKNIEEMTPEEEDAYAKLIQSNIITETVEKAPNMKEEDIAQAAKTIAKTYPIEERLIRRLLRIQVQRTQVSPLYDLDYDVQLVKAIELIQNNNFSDLMRNTKTLKELQDAALLQEEKDSKTDK